MWYVMQVISGQENRAVLLTEKLTDDGILENCFVPMRRLKKKFHGEWNEVTEKLFPGYVFLITERPGLLYEELKKIPILTRILGRSGEYFTPLAEADVHMMEKLQNMQKRIENGGGMEADISTITIEEGNQIRILSGPLINLEGQIRKVNLHKRIAEVEMEFMGNRTVVHLGIEIVKKKDSTKRRR